MGGNEEALKFIGAMVGVSRENFERALDLIDAQYGSLSAYLAGPLGFGPRRGGVWGVFFLCLCGGQIFSKQGGPPL